MGVVKSVKVSPEGQILIPAAIRESLKIEAGDKFVALMSGDVIFLKLQRLREPEPSDISEEEAMAIVNAIIKEVREEERAKRRQAQETIV